MLTSEFSDWDNDVLSANFISTWELSRVVILSPSKTSLPLDNSRVPASEFAKACPLIDTTTPTLFPDSVVSGIINSY